MRVIGVILIGCVSVLWSSSLGAAEAGPVVKRLRTFTDSAGEKSFQAEFVSLDDAIVTLRKADGTLVTIEIESLSKADRDYVKGKIGYSDASDQPQSQKREHVELETTDRVRLKAMFFPGADGEDTVPIILLHAWKASGTENYDLAEFLQRRGHAVLVPDLRGHGHSTTKLGQRRPLTPGRNNRVHVDPVVRYDMETLKLFLVNENNHKRLNIEKLCVVGIGVNASAALYWTGTDWSWPTLAGGDCRQGGDVKALVLISPEWMDSLRKAINHPGMRDNVSVLLIVGNERLQRIKDAKALQSEFKHARSRAASGARLQKEPLLYEREAPLNELLATHSVWERIAKFIEEEIGKRTYEWKRRTNPP